MQGLLRIAQPFDAGRLAQIKRQTNDWEETYAAEAGLSEPRPLNLDPGYLTLAKLVLASTKDGSHRIYLGEGIYAEVTLFFHRRRWEHIPGRMPIIAGKTTRRFSWNAANGCGHRVKKEPRMIWLVLGSLLPSMAITFCGAWLVRGLGPRCGLVDFPGRRKIHDRPMPTCGGLAIWLGIVGAVALGQLALWLLRSTPAGAAAAGRLPGFIRPHLPGLWQQSGRLWIVLAGGTVLTGLGLADDRRGLDWRLRLAVQFLVALAMVLLGWRTTLGGSLPLLGGALSVLWIVGLVNAFNMLDNMDGLSAGVAAIAAVMLAMVMLLAPVPSPACRNCSSAAFSWSWPAPCWVSCGTIGRRPGYSWATQAAT